MDLNIKKCTKCGEAKSLEMFARDKRGRFGKRSECKDCMHIRQKEHYCLNIEKCRSSASKSQRKRYAEDKEFRQLKLAKNKKWIEENKERFRELNKLQRRKERRTVKGNIDCRMSRSICASLKVKTVGGKTRRKWEDLVGYSVSDLKIHLENQFTNEMSWELFLNGGIHIDHIRPKNSFFYESMDSQEFKDCWSLDNLQPLFAIDNLRKGAQMSYEP